MNRQQMLQLVIAVMLVMLFLIGCGAPAAESPPATATPLSPSAATPTPVPPTATPTPKPPAATPTSTSTPEPIVPSSLLGSWWLETSIGMSGTKGKVESKIIFELAPDGLLAGEGIILIQEYDQIPDMLVPDNCQDRRTVSGPLELSGHYERSRFLFDPVSPIDAKDATTLIEYSCDSGPFQEISEAPGKMLE